MIICIMTHVVGDLSSYVITHVFSDPSDAIFTNSPSLLWPIKKRKT